METALRGASDLTHGDKTVLMVMFTYADADGKNIRPGRQRIINDACIGKSKLNGHLKKLLDLGYLILTEQGGNQVRKGWANVYRLGIPHRLTQDASYPATGTLDQESGYPQGAPSRNQGTPLRVPRYPATGPEGTPSRGTHQVIDQGIHQVMDQGALDSPRSSDAPRNLPVDLPDASRAELINALQALAEALITNCPPERYEEAEEHLLITIGHYLGDEAAELWEHEWNVAGPQTTHAGAEQKLNHFIGHMVQAGHPITAMEGAA